MVFHGTLINLPRRALEKPHSTLWTLPDAKTITIRNIETIRPKPILGKFFIVCKVLELTSYKFGFCLVSSVSHIYPNSKIYFMYINLYNTLSVMVQRADLPPLHDAMCMGKLLVYFSSIFQQLLQLHRLFSSLHRRHAVHFYIGQSVHLCFAHICSCHSVANG